MTKCCPSSQFNSVSHYSDQLLNTELESNLKVFLDWCFLGIGAWTNVTIPTSGAFGGSWHQLIPINDPSYSYGQVWETARKDWVYETNVGYSGYNDPISISGVYVNGVLKGTGDATYGHHYNYPLGRIVFNSPIDPLSTVTLNYSYRNVQVYVADQAPWWDELQYNSFRVDDEHFSPSASGDWAILSNHRVQLPAVVLEVIPRRRFKPFQLGDCGNIVEQDMAFHILSQTRFERNQIVDIISLQNDKNIGLFDSDKVAVSGRFPLDYRGMINPSGLMYPSLIQEPYFWYHARMTQTIVSEVYSHNPMLHEGTVRTTFEIIYPYF